jgi:hypothetical protein
MWAFGEFPTLAFTTYSLLSNHPALNDLSGLCADFFFDDFHLWRLFIELLEATPLFGIQKIGDKLQVLVSSFLI